MAVDVCSEISSSVTSPRISFSYDVNQTDVVPIERLHRRSDALLLDFSIDFDFGVTNKSHVQEISSADELFSNGKILPTQITKKETRQSEQMVTHHPQPPKTTATVLHCENKNADAKKKRLKEFLHESNEEGKAAASRSFWQFKRSASLKVDNGRSKGLIRSLQILALSKSTGSASNSKQTGLTTGSASNSKQTGLTKATTTTTSAKQTSHKQCSNSLIPPFNGYQFNNNSLGRPPSLKQCRSYSSGVRINPILNIPLSYISKGTAHLFGFGSFFGNGKSKKKKK